MDETTTLTGSSEAQRSNHNNGETDKSLIIVFSDLDGTLIHYPDSTSEQMPSEGILKLPPSSTGMMGIISYQTLAKCRQLRNNGVKLILVSGMRSLTLLKRLPYLPRADAYCCEAGGRIYYPSTTAMDDPSFRIEPVAYDGATKEDLEPFYVCEDTEWRRRMEQKNAAGLDGFGLRDPTTDETSSIEQRTGSLWSFAQSLQEQGLVLDTKGYATCFRVNRSQQTVDRLFDELLSGAIPHPPELASSVNLGCIDFYPNISGKKHW